MQIDARGELVRGLLGIDEAQAEIVRRIFRDFAGGLSSIAIAKALNEEGVRGPRGGEWNASTIRGDPRKLVGILNNPLYNGELVWKRREWRKDPDSDKRERRYKLRPESEWLRVGLPDLRIVDEASWLAVQSELERRRRPDDAPSPARQRRAKHLLSGTIKCSVCGSNYTISGKDYYRCAGVKERGTCDNRVSVRKGALEKAVLSILQGDLLKPDLAELFVAEFKREMARLARDDERQADDGKERLSELDAQIETLARNMLVSAASPTLHRMLAELEQERTTLKARHAPAQSVIAEILPHPTLLKLFEEKVARLRGALNDEMIATQAASTLSSLIESVTIYPGAEPQAEVAADVGRLIAFAANENTRPGGCLDGSSTMVVAGVGFEPTTFRL